MTRPSLRSWFALTIVLALTSGALAGDTAANTPPPNTLTTAERRAGWRLLFDGKTTRGWRGFRRASFPRAGWAVESDGTLHRTKLGEGCEGPGDIITEEQFENFELVLQWKLSPGGNSGVKYLIDESRVKEGHGGLGFEMQILDDERHPDAKKGKNGNRTAGALYDLIAPSQSAARPPGEWNDARLLVNGNHIEHWLNGVKVVEYERASPELRALIAGSKYAQHEGFGDNARGHILLQDHNDEAWFRNIKLRPLKPASTARAAR